MHAGTSTDAFIVGISQMTETKEDHAVKPDKLKMKPVVKLTRLDDQPKTGKATRSEVDPPNTNADSDSGSSTIIYSLASTPILLVNDPTDR